MDDLDLFRTKSVAEGVRSRASKSHPRPLQKVEDPLLKFLANQVVSARQKLGIMQDQLAEKAGCAPLTVTNIESGRRNVTLKSLSLLATALEIDLRDLFPPAKSVLKGTVSDDFAKVISDMAPGRVDVASHSLFRQSFVAHMASSSVNDA